MKSDSLAQNTSGLTQINECKAADLNELRPNMVSRTELFGAIFHAANDAILILDRMGVIRDLNPVAERIFQKSYDSILGTAFSSLFPKTEIEGTQKTVERLVLAKKTNAAVRKVTYTRNGCKEQEIEFTLKAILYDDEEYVVSFARDISELKASQRRIRELICSLERTKSELDQFAYVASHDLKAPLRVIENASSWLAEDLENHLTDDNRENLALVQSRVKRMVGLLDDLLAHSRIGRIKYPHHSVSGTKLSEDLIDLLEIPSGFAINFSDTFGEIEIPQMPVQMVLLNLLNNAIRHHNKAKGEIDVSVVLLPDGYLFTVSDDGPGIAPKYHDRIFDMFQTMKSRDALEASGIGLAMVRKQVEHVGGRLTLESNVGEGATFRVFWPNEEASAMPNKRTTS